MNNTDNQIIGVQEAREQKLNYYFTGRPCKHGHIAKRILYSGTCVECTRIYSKKHTKSFADLSPEQKRHRLDRQHELYRDPFYTNKRLVDKYGLTLELYNVMLENQHYKCRICLSVLQPNTKNVHVDHCHTTNKVRGLLCHTCNVGLGMFKDDVALLRTAANYLELT